MKKLICILILTTALAIAGCSGGTAVPTAPVSTGETTGAPSANHAILGYWQMVADPEKGTLDVVELRGTAMHLNALHFLEPPPLLNLTLESLEFIGDKIEADIGLRHPFLGLNEFTGFDVCGILITNGSISGFHDPLLRMAGAGDTRLLNPDGLTRWWNPAEFPVNNGTMFSYKDGLLGTGDSTANYNSTLNAYKLFCDDLNDPDAPVSSLAPASRCIFSAGTKNIRHYSIELGSDGLIFNYAVDACWQFPMGSPPWSVPDDFGPNANRPEAWNISTTVLKNTLYNDGSTSGGELTLNIDVWDHFDAELNTVWVDSPGNFAYTSSGTPTGGGEGYSTYTIDITDATPTPGSIDILIGIECEQDGYQDLGPTGPITAYSPLLAVEVGNEPPSNVNLIWHDEGLANSDGQSANDDIEPALTIDGTGVLRLSFFWWYQDTPTHWWNRPRFVTSNDGGLTFGPYEIGQWNAHGVGPTQVLCYNGKYTVGPNGQAWHSYNCPAGHALHPNPTFSPYTEAASHSGTPIGHAGEMLYTSEGYPMMFGDSGGKINMRRGDYPNQGGTGNWPVFLGTSYELVAKGWLSIVRSTGKTSDGICRLVYWKEGIDGPIRMLSSDDISGTSWTNESVIQNGAAEIWVGAHDPSLWIDENDHYHVAYAGDTWMGSARLVYAYSEDGITWSNYIVGNAVLFTDLALHDTGVVTVNALDGQFILLGYEYKGEVWC